MLEVVNSNLKLKMSIPFINNLKTNEKTKIKHLPKKYIFIGMII